MKFNKTIVATLLVVLVVLGCHEDPDSGSFKDLSPYAQQYLSIRIGSSRAFNASNDAMINSTFQGVMSHINGRIKGDTTDADTTIYPPQWTTCAAISTFQNDDGSTTTITDYGDGCEEGWEGYKYWMHGKITQTSRYQIDEQNSMTTNDYLFKGVYENYGGNYTSSDSTAWTINGGSHYTGYSTYDASWKKFFGACSYRDSTEYQYNGGTNSYRSAGETEYDEKHYVVKKAEYRYGDGDNFYSSKVTKELVYDYTCNPRDTNWHGNYVWIYTSGKEEVSYNQNGVSSSFEIDYGDGTCDNVVYITENGKRVRVDYGEMVWID